MSHTKFYIVVTVLACVAWYLNTKRRLTFGEKKKVFWCALLAFPVVMVVSRAVLGDVHDEAYQANQPAFGIRDDDSALALLSWLLGGAASLAVLGFAERVQRSRDDEYFAQLEAQRLGRIEQAKYAEIAAEQRKIDGARAAEQLKLDTNLKIAETRRSTLLTAIAINHREAASKEAEHLLFDAFQKYCERANVYQHKTIDELRDEFRLELARRSIPKINLRELEQSPNPAVQQLLKRPNLKLVP